MNFGELRLRSETIPIGRRVLFLLGVGSVAVGLPASACSLLLVALQRRIIKSLQLHDWTIQYEIWWALSSPVVETTQDLSACLCISVLAEFIRWKKVFFQTFFRLTFVHTHAYGRQGKKFIQSFPYYHTITIAPVTLYHFRTGKSNWKVFHYLTRKMSAIDVKHMK